MRSSLLTILFVCTITAAMSQTLGTWSNTGPIQFPVNVSGQVDGIGRTCQIKFHPTNPQKMYAVSASGGLFISSNNGLTWAPTLGTDQLPTTACASVCIDYTNDNILYLSTGDPNYYGDDFGIWKSTNGGNTWAASNAGIGNRMAVEILMDPNDHTVLVAATDDGIWKSTNSGATWTGQFTGKHFRDMKLKPTTRTLYAVTEMEFYKSTDFGNTWTQVTSGVTPPANNGGMRIAVSPADTNRVYVATTDGFGIVFRSNDGAQTFTQIYSSTTQCVVCYDTSVTSGSQGDYNFDLTANPTNADEVILVSHCVWRSIDGGYNWGWRTQWWNQVHTDMHHIEFNPYNPTQLFNANDGGVWLSTDPLATAWGPRADGLAASEIYHAAQSQKIRQLISIGTQDNGELYFDGIWKCNRGGDWGSVCSFDYLGTGSTVWYLDAGNRRNLQPLAGDQSFALPYLAGYANAVAFHPNVPNVAYLAKDTIYRSTDINANPPTWTQIDIFSGSTLDVSFCAADSNIVYAVGDDGYIYRCDNALAANPIFVAFLTPFTTTNGASIATNKSDPNIVYLSCGNRLYRSANKGQTWTNITYNLPNLNIRKVFHDDYLPNERLYVNSGSYVYYKDNTTTTWTNYSNAYGLPSVANVSDFMMYNNGTSASVLRLSTYGRGLWECAMNVNLPPACTFTADKQNICADDTVHYTGTLFGNYTSYSWTFPGGIPATSTALNPVVVYPANGTYNAILTATGPGGITADTQFSYIVVSLGIGGTIQEGFEGPTYPSTGWSLASHTGAAWTVTGIGGGFGTSAHSILADNFDNDGGGQHDAIISPKINLTGATNPYVTFDRAYARYPGYNDSLMVQVSTDCGKHYAPVYIKYDTALATAPDKTDSIFKPTAAQWRKDTIWLTAYVGNSVMLSFENIGHYGQALYLDNINIVGALGVEPIADNYSLKVYPNPTTGLLNISAEGLQGNNATISCYDIVGKLILQRTLSNNNHTLNTSIDISNMPKGVYLMQIQTDAGTQYVKRIVLE
ncbi:MAG: T9SS type A sorting domain-containing protein [Bacteroidota bacterium]